MGIKKKKMIIAVLKVLIVLATSMWVSSPNLRAAASSTATTYFSEGFENGTFAGWDFYYSTNGAQSGSVAAGTWSSSIVSGVSALSGSYSARLFADSNAHADPWRVDAAINRTLNRNDATVLKAMFKFDAITDPLPGRGHAFFLITVWNALNTSESISYGFDNSPLRTPGVISYDVSPGDLVNFTADVATDYFSKYGRDLPAEVTIRFMVSADWNEDGSGRQTVEVRLDDIALIRVPPKDVLIIDDARKYAYFGWFNTSAMPSSGLGASASSNTTIYVDPAVVEVYSPPEGLGYRFNVTVRVGNVTDLSAWAVKMNYNSTVLNATGAWIPSWDSEYIFYNRSAINPGPWFGVDYVNLNDALLALPTVQGNGTLAIIEFEVIILPPEGGYVESPLSINNAATFLTDSIAAQIPATKIDGLYRNIWRPPVGWNLLNRTIMWAASFMLPNETKIVLFTYEGSLDPVTDPSGKAVYDKLIAWGYAAANISVHHRSDIETLSSSYYTPFHLVIYAWSNSYDSTNVVNSSVPFITFAAGQTDEMGIGTGVTTMHAYNDTFYVVNNNYYPTENYPLGPLLFESGMEFEATEAAGRGRVLVKAEVVSVGPQVEMSLIQDIAVLPDGSAHMSFTINIPQSPLADMYREAFFENASSLEPGVEYDVPENKTVRDTIDVEEGVKDISLVGDINGDGKTDIKDIATVAIAFGSLLGDERWDAERDINWDGKIDIRDIATAARNFGMTRWNTGHLNVIGYYNGTAVNSTRVYYLGPRGTAEINMSASGHTWHYILPGVYTVYGTYNMTEHSTTVTVEPEKTSYAQLDFGGAYRPPPPQTELVPVRELFHQGIVMEQLALLGFQTDVTESRIVPWGTNNETRLSLTAFSPQLAMPIEHPIWRIYVGPWDENATGIVVAEFMITKIQFLQQMLQSLPGDQVYLFNWQTSIELPPGAELLNVTEITGLNWTIDLGGGTFMKAHVTLDLPRVTLDETMVVTEQTITAEEEYLGHAFGEYKMFKIDYSLPGPPLGQVTEVEASNVNDDWSKTWTWTISPGTYVKSWSYGPLTATVRVIPTLTTQWYVGWYFYRWRHRHKWYLPRHYHYRLEWFKTWMKITPSVKVEASVTAGASYSKTWSHTFWTWSKWFHFWVGWVYVPAKLRLKVTGSITVNAEAQISISTWARAYAYFKAGVIWTRSSGWSRIREHGWGASYSPPTISYEAYLTVTPKAKLRISFLFYDVAGPFVEGIPYAPITIHVLPSRTWSIALKFKINAGVTFAGWLKSAIGLSDYSRTLYDWTLKSWSGTW